MIVQVEPKVKFDFSKTDEEKEKLANAKAQYKSAMKAHLGSNWKVKARVLGIHNPPN
jgi:hypothetical protein